MRHTSAIAGILAGWMLAGLRAETVRAESTDARLAELERRIELIAVDLERERLGDIYVPVGDSYHGLGPAASKIYARERGTSLGGYGEVLYENYRDDRTDRADALRAVLYVGHRFSDRWLLNSEFEFEHGSTSEGGSVSAEFLYLDYLYHSALNLRMGLVLIPMGLVNEYHEPTTFLGARRPDVERVLIPSTWRENGIGLFGDIGDFSYKAFVVSGLRADRFSPDGIRSGRQKGAKARSDDLAGVGRLDWTGPGGLNLGVAMYYGDSGQDLDIGVRTRIVEAHADWEHRGFRTRALIVSTRLGDAAELNRLRYGHDGAATVADGDIESIGERMFGGYIEAGYDIFRHRAGAAALTPFVRYERYDTQDRIPEGFQRSGAHDVRLWTLGIDYKPLPEIVLKADCQFYDNQTGSLGNQFNLAFGYIF